MFTYQIHSIIFIFWICLQIFEFLTFHFLMEILSHKMSKIGLILFGHKSAPFPTFPVSGNKNANWWLRNLCLSWLSPSPSPLTSIQQLISMAFASCKLWNPSPRALLWSGSHLLLGGPSPSLAGRTTSPHTGISFWSHFLLSPPHHHQS